MFLYISQYFIYIYIYIYIIIIIIIIIKYAYVNRNSQLHVLTVIKRLWMFFYCKRNVCVIFLHPSKITSTIIMMLIIMIMIIIWILLNCRKIVEHEGDVHTSLADALRTLTIGLEKRLINCKVSKELEPSWWLWYCSCFGYLEVSWRLDKACFDSDICKKIPC